MTLSRQYVNVKLLGTHGFVNHTLGIPKFQITLLNETIENPIPFIKETHFGRK